MAVDEEQKEILEEYKTWKKNCRFLYDLMLSSVFEWPSPTMQWLPDKTDVKDDAMDYCIHRMLCGTNATDDTNYVTFAEVRLPTPDVEVLRRKYHDSLEMYSGFGGAAGKIEVTQRIVHKGEVNRARYMPQKPTIIATKNASGDVFLFDKEKHPLKPDTSTFIPNATLSGHSGDGYGLCWNQLAAGKGLLASGGYEDMCVCIWDTNKLTAASAGSGVPAHSRLLGHIGFVEDVVWSKCHSDVLFSVGDDKRLVIWDARSGKAQCSVEKAHKAEANCVDTSPFSEHLFVTGGSDRQIALWDSRKLSQRLHCLEAHTGDVLRVEWSPHSEVHLLSCGSDRRVMLWDLSQIGLEQSAEDADDGPPELVFTHGGHTDVVTDVGWNPHEPWLIGSVAENNVLHVWQMTDELLNWHDTTQFVDLE